MGKSIRFDESILKDKGYTKMPDGSFKKLDSTQKRKVTVDVLFEKQKVNESKDFNVKPVTEWFIKNYSVPSKKNSRQNFVRNGKQISIPSKKHAEYVKGTAMQYEVFGREFRRSVEQLKLSYPLRVEFTFIRNTKHRCDFSNMLQTAEDLMVSNKWILDDDALHLLPSFQPLEYSKTEFGVKIKLLY